MYLHTINESLFRTFYYKWWWFILCIYSIFIDLVVKTCLCLCLCSLIEDYFLYFLWPLTTIRSHLPKNILVPANAWHLGNYRSILLWLRVLWTNPSLSLMGKLKEAAEALQCVAVNCWLVKVVLLGLWPPLLKLDIWKKLSERHDRVSPLGMNELIDQK